MARSPRSWGRTAPASRRCPSDRRARPAMRSPAAKCCSTARTCSNLRPDERAAKGVFLAFQYPLEIPGVATMTFLKAHQRAAQERGEPELTTPDFMSACARARDKLEHRPGHAAPPGQRRLLRRREEAHRNVADGAAGAALCVLDETDSGLDIDALQDRRRRRQSSAHAGTRRSSSSRIISACSTISCPTSCM